MGEKIYELPCDRITKFPATEDKCLRDTCRWPKSRCMLIVSKPNKSMIGENRHLGADEPVELEIQPVEVTAANIPKAN